MGSMLQALVLLTLRILMSPAFVKAQSVVTADQIALANQTYDFSAQSRCRLAGHQSGLLHYGDNYILVVDGGFGSFSTELNGKQVTVLDLNPFTAAFDLSRDFVTPGLEPLWMIKKSPGIGDNPPTNHGGIFISEDETTLYYQGGHFYNKTSWNPSAFHVTKADIQAWQLWQMNVSAGASTWKDVTESVSGHELAVRTFAGAAVSVPKAKKSFWIGGLIDPTTSATSSNDTLQTTDQMLVFDHETNSLTRQKYYSDHPTTGEWQGDLVHLPIGPGNGYLMSLMSLSKPLNTTWVDVDGPDGNQEIGDPKLLDSIPLYDIDSGVWFVQKTSWFMDQIPEPRTRFCTAVFHDPADNTWSLWVHGGQLVSDQNVGVREVYVLSMPSFIWTKVDTALSDTNLIRSHTCHAIGGQLLIVGGYPPGLDVPTNATCDPEYIKVLNIDADGVSWTSTFTTKSTFVTPSNVRNVIGGRTTPIPGFANQKLAEDFGWRTPKSSSTRGAIAGGVIGGVLFLVLIGLLIWRYRGRLPSPWRRNHGDHTIATSSLAGDGRRRRSYGYGYGYGHNHDRSDGEQPEVVTATTPAAYSPVLQTRSAQWQYHELHQQQPEFQPQPYEQHQQRHRQPQQNQQHQQHQEQPVSPVTEMPSPTLHRTGTHELETGATRAELGNTTLHWH